MRVSHVITRLILGGAQENTVSTVIGLQADPDFRVDLVSGPTHGSEGTLEHLLKPFPGVLVRSPNLVRPVHPPRDWLALRDLTRLFKRWRPRIVHTHSGKAGILGRLAAHRAGVPIIVHTIHGPSFGPFQGPAANALFRSMEQFAARVTTHFVSVADAMTDQYLAAGIGCPSNFTRVLSGFDIAGFLDARPDARLRASLRIGSGDFVVGMVARLTERKGHDDFLDAARSILARCPRARFLWVGDGPWRDRLWARVCELGLAPRFVFAGMVPPDQVPRFVALMDVLVHLSTREGLPRALPQALAAGKPVIAYDCDGAREVCLPGKTGFLVRIGDRQGLLDSLVRLESDPDRAREFGETGRDWVRDRFSVETMVESLKDLYRRLEREAAGNAAEPT